MKYNALLLLAALAFSSTVAAQNNIVKSLESPVAGQGKVSIHQDPRIANLIGKEAIHSSTGERAVIKSQGYRIQAYAGNNTRAAKNEAYACSARIKEYFPELSVYTTFNPPRWLCRAGDFRTIEEADAMMRRLRATGVFKEVSIVKDHVNLSM